MLSKRHTPRLLLAATIVAGLQLWAQGKGGGGPKMGGGPAASRPPIVIGGAGGPIRFPKAPKATPKAQDKGVDKMARRTAELDRFDRMTPEQRQKALDKLPAARRQRIEQGLEQYRAMNPQARERLLEFERMPVEQRDAVRQNFRRLQELPQPRRAAVRREMQLLRGMSAEEREERLQSQPFRKRFDSGEQSLIRDTVANLPSAPQQAQQQQPDPEP